MKTRKELEQDALIHRMAQVMLGALPYLVEFTEQTKRTHPKDDGPGLILKDFETLLKESGHVDDWSLRISLGRL